MKINSVMEKLTLEAEISIEKGDWKDLEPVIDKCFDTVISADIEGLRSGIVSFLFSDDETIRTLNRDYRGKDKATNVLSFPSDLDCPVDVEELSPIIGDIALAYETCAKEASDLQIDFETHLTHLIIHGILHLLGYDHIDDAEAEQMESLEKELLGKMGISDPYSRMEKLNG